MKLNSLSWAALGASLALFQGAQAAPIRVTIVTHQDWTGPVPNVVGPDGTVFRMGHAMAGAEPPMIPGARKPGCHMRPPTGGRMSLGDAIRKAMGMPPIEHEVKHSHGHYRLKLVDPVGTPLPGPDVKVVTNVMTVNRPFVHGSHAMLPENGELSFLRRVHASLLMLGKWEARAVAFVLGCGIGVLLRMIWVFMVLIFRGIREEPANTADAEYTLVLAHVDDTLPKYADETQDTAPAYVDEKTEQPTGA